ncbi:hypothetical protein E2C01_071896 [Portunus trituberculatus]|uniref:Uncharacterized protein n=1 Tax=Portunus trituberculatus TaxID=210409 RepID=A0A5B7I537_PORTR|nr:hypothetical protein [Portunus trituberculatus]
MEEVKRNTGAGSFFLFSPQPRLIFCSTPANTQHVRVHPSIPSTQFHTKAPSERPMDRHSLQIASDS